MVFIDPSERMAAAVSADLDPFMGYDTHWSAVGHEIVAQLVAEMLGQGTCP
jgi:hypothetical protein